VDAARAGTMHTADAMRLVRNGNAARPVFRLTTVSRVPLFSDVTDVKVVQL